MILVGVFFGKEKVIQAVKIMGEGLFLFREKKCLCRFGLSK